MTKGKAFVICIIAIMVIFSSLFVLVAVKDKDISFIPVAAGLTAIVSITTAYMGIQMANNGIKGHNWNQDMFDSENPQEAKK
jgi:uncharacterized protein (DUF983 family)